MQSAACVGLVCASAATQGVADVHLLKVKKLFSLPDELQHKFL